MYLLGTSLMCNGYLRSIISFQHSRLCCFQGQRLFPMRLSPTQAGYDERFLHITHILYNQLRSVSSIFGKVRFVVLVYLCTSTISRSLLFNPRDSLFKRCVYYFILSLTDLFYNISFHASIYQYLTAGPVS